MKYGFWQKHPIELPEGSYSSTALTEADSQPAAQGFRDGVASVSAGSEPVATVFTMEALTPGGGGKYHATIHKALPAGTKLYTHPSPTEGMAGWQPIETAPRDGTPLLLRSKKGRIADGAWITATSSCGGWAWAYVNLEPIEWQPLPVEPSMDGESNG